MSDKPLGISGRIAKAFQDTEITPLLALIGLLLGLFAIMVTPREEEPQIDVTFANIFIAYPGASAGEVERLISTPAEQIVSEIEGIEHVYSVSKPGLSILTAQFEVGEESTSAIVRLYNKIYSNSDWLPTQLGVAQPIIKPKGIDDVPIVSLTLWTEDPQRGAHELQKVAHAVEAELKRVPGTRDIYTIGGPDNVVRIQLDPQRLAGYDIDLEELKQALLAANSSAEAGVLVQADQESSVQAGVFLTTLEEISSLVIGIKNEAPIYLRDVATVIAGADQPTEYVWMGTGPAAEHKGIAVQGEFPAVTLAIAKQPGQNAVDIADAVIARFNDLKGIVVPDGVEVTVTRNYGQTADDKAQTLIKKLVFVTIAVVLLVWLALGWREAIIVGVAVVITLMLMLFASWAWGFTLNRVSLFALIFSIGILVDDAIVVVENIHRHQKIGGKSLKEAIPIAVDEVGGPTILATFAVIAALLPMAFVSGLMGPYMAPIPINASMGMLLSLLVAYILTPWMVLKMMASQSHSTNSSSEISQNNASYRLFNRVIGVFVLSRAARLWRWMLLLVMIVLIAASVGLGTMKLVVLKMLPFDNKSEFQVVVDMPEGTSLEHTAGLMRELGAHLSTVPEVTDYQAYVGTASPINFNGLVRQYYLREGSEVADIQVNLVDKKLRDRKSHEIASSTREALQEIGQRWGGNIKIVEVPPGPPVQSPIVAEIYGLDYDSQLTVAKQVRAAFEQSDDVVDIDDSVEFAAPRKVVKIDQQKAALLGLSQSQIVSAIRMALAGEDVGYLHDSTVKYAVPLRLEFPVSEQRDLSAVLKLRLRNTSGNLIAMGDVVNVVDTQREQTIYHKDLLPVVFVTADMAGDLDSPLYGMFDIFAGLQDTSIEQFFINAPILPVNDSLKWDGEWQVTYETFRDMGLAYAVGIILIYLLVVAQFRSYLIPLVIMAPIPLTIIGVMPGHALLSAQFTATSMIGMIAMAGIIVRNSILLVDFINQALASGMKLEEAVIRAAAVRAKPIILTAAAAMLGALFILDDPIFNGLAVALLFGILVSTVLTLLVIPVMYYAFTKRKYV
ncbi:MAG: efflux RND transporter permease subunit [Methylophaga sp.]|nr:efflux RND transporter permease subunit [Methylophaga sp.]